MDMLHIFLVVLLGVVSCSHGWISGSVLDVTVRPGDNITLLCDCKLSTDVYIVWLRNCSHENQPSLLLETKYDSSRDNTADPLNVLPRFRFVRNFSSNSYDLLIMNITNSDEGLYYCGTKHKRVEDEKYISLIYGYRYGNITTRITLNSSPHPDSSECKSSHLPVVSWITVFTPAFTILSSVLSFILIYHFCQKADNQILQNRLDTLGQTRWNQDEDIFLTRVVFRVKDGQTHQ